MAFLIHIWMSCLWDELLLSFVLVTMRVTAKNGMPALILFAEQTIYYYVCAVWNIGFMDIINFQRVAGGSGG